MKNRYLLTPFLLTAAMAGAQSAHAATVPVDVAFWTFNTGSANAQFGQTNQKITSNFSSPNADGSPSVNNVTSDIKFGANGTTINNTAQGTVAAQPAAGSGPGSTATIRVFNGTSGNQGKYIQFGANLSIYKDVKINYASQLAGNGFTTQQLQYSINGGAYSVFAPTQTVTTTYGLKTFDLSSLSQLDNVNATFRIYFTGGYNGTGSTTVSNNANFIDNLSITAVTTPEPSTWAMMGLGLGALAFMARRRKRESGEVSFSGVTA